MRKNNPLSLAALAAAGLALGGCASTQPVASTTTAAPTAETPPMAVPAPKGTGLNVANINTSADPCDDFFEYASGSWLKNNPIPAAEVRWGSFNELADKNNAVMRQILDESAANTSAAKGSNAQKVGDFYASAMDSAAIDAAGLKYLQPELDRISKIKTLKDVQTVLPQQMRLQTGAFFGGYVGQDDKKSDEYAVNLYQGGLSLPDRDYYLKDDARSKGIRAAYTTYLTNTFKLLGDNPTTAAKNAVAVMALETKLAKASKTRVALRDPNANYNKMSVAEANKRFPNLALPATLKTLNLGAAQQVIVGQPEFMQEVSNLMKQTPVTDLKTYMRWHLVSSLSSALPKAYGDEQFRFSQVLSGAKQQQPRWKRMLRSTDGALGEAFGQVYVEKAFTPETKQKALVMVNNIRAAMGEHINKLDWMSPATKAEAQKKLAAFTVKIGYPDKWKDYSALNISRDSYLQNVLAARQWSYADNTSKFGKPIDRQEWGMTPPTVNAYFNPSMNEIVFPAGIMQPPFFDPNADDAVNYGGMGAVIGHEITHGFDDQGRQYDAAGNLRDWWTKEDADKFQQRADMVDKQYSAFSPLDSVFVNGKLTMGENLADFGGLALAYSALQKANAGKNVPKYDGFTPEQRFFLAWAQVWRTNARPEYLRQQVMTDPHSPAQYRTVGPLMNMPEFYEAFGCKENAKMMRAQADRAKIW
ncbi:M13 family metallopeptidase [Hymenobacter terrestris]|uniref:M13 family metallopeptidase n=1 Tax=Hymenobacter terrestris TaxID=2748310 RepID=A0ABX2Q3X7_9BACT|nr:M13 family metallopeptidase [Hymenobacter terrestris]NVO85671.1 M13 family metallopeptidase [Hymenobacter terrestris]